MIDERQEAGTGQHQEQQTAKLDTQAAKHISLPPALTVKQLGELLGVNAVDIIKQLMRNGLMANINQTVDFNVASVIAENFGFKVKRQPTSTKSKAVPTAKAAKSGKLAPRPPVITIMGHVDHGKTSLLDAIRQSNVTATEAGAITQHIGAYQVERDGRKITFLDTPGHEAFTAMRARGAQATDIAVLVVAADDGVMPQTVEAIHHAQAAGVPIVVALNKIDKSTANPEKIKQQLSDLDLVIEEWGGDTICIPISAKKQQGINDLLENLLVLADILELKAKPDGPAEGVVIEAKLDKTMGPLATLLVQKGILKIGDIAVLGTTHGKVKAMFNDAGKQIKTAGPSTPVKILGLNEVSPAGDTFKVVNDEREARALLEKRKSTQQAFASTARTLSLSDFSAKVSSGGQVKDLNIILKTDVQGSIEPIKDSLEKLSSEQITVRVIHTNSGSITESDVMLALASNGIVIGFNTRPEPGAQRLADLEKVSIRYYNVIYDLMKDVEKALKGMLDPTYTEVIDALAEVKAIFDKGRKGRIAGVIVKEGRVGRDSSARVIRKGETLVDSRVSSLKRFKNDVKEVPTGQECGVGVENFSDFQVGDIIQFYRREKVS